MTACSSIEKYGHRVMGPSSEAIDLLVTELTLIALSFCSSDPLILERDGTIVAEFFQQHIAENVLPVYPVMPLLESDSIMCYTISILGMIMLESMQQRLQKPSSDLLLRCLLLRCQEILITSDFDKSTILTDDASERDFLVLALINYSERYLALYAEKLTSHNPWSKVVTSACDLRSTGELIAVPPGCTDLRRIVRLILLVDAAAGTTTQTANLSPQTQT